MSKQIIIPINVDRNVSFADYRQFEGKRQLLVAERGIFYTIQGEGPLGGQPCVFLRLAGCNLGAKEDCAFCDTRFDYDKGTTWTVEALAQELTKKADGKTRLIVVTGGEPLLQQDNLTALINEMSDFDFQIETNGYFVRDSTFQGANLGLRDVSIVISPKVADTKGEYPKMKDTWFNEVYPVNYLTYLKYVVTADPTSPYHEIPADVIQRCKESDTTLYVSGMAVYLKSYPDDRISSIWHTDEIDQKATGENYRYAAQYALKHGLRLSYQTHLFGAIE